MPTLKEIKGRIASVKSTLKITSAMKLVSSAKLRKAQQAIESMCPYQQQLQRMLSAATPSTETAHSVLGSPQTPGPEEASSPRVIIAIASNSSLCGGFNANVIGKVRSLRASGDEVWSIGRKMADAMRKDGFPSPADYSSLNEHPSYGPCAQLVEQLSQSFSDGLIHEVLLVYNHFVSTARQEVVVERLLPSFPSTPSYPSAPFPPQPDVIIEPSPAELFSVLLPKTLKLKLYAALLDSAAAEHAARTVAMQAATDNGNQLLDELTLQYNKGRQQKITNEILDLAAGSAD